MDHPTPGGVYASLVPFEKSSENVQTLIKSALQARQYAYVPYSKFPVGAALLCEDGEIIQGCNVENSSFGVSVCAEQTAIVKAVSAGKKNFSAIAVVGSPDLLTTPCGRCRQFIFEFGSNIDIYCARVGMGNILITNINGLLPCGFKYIADKSHIEEEEEEEEKI